jgi:hypothetical protein
MSAMGGKLPEDGERDCPPQRRVRSTAENGVRDGDQCEPCAQRASAVQQLLQDAGPGKPPESTAGGLPPAEHRPGEAEFCSLLGRRSFGARFAPDSLGQGSGHWQIEAENSILEVGALLVPFLISSARQRLPHLFGEC